MNYFNKMSGGDNNIGFNNSVFLSERDTADRNFALAYFMKENKCFPPDFNLQETLDFYFQVMEKQIISINPNSKHLNLNKAKFLFQNLSLNFMSRGQVKVPCQGVRT